VLIHEFDGGGWWCSEIMNDYYVPNKVSVVQYSFLFGFKPFYYSKFLLLSIMACIFTDVSEELATSILRVVKEGISP
jgi:hypothetical protein